MTPDKAYAAIIINIDTYKQQVEEEWNYPQECKDFPGWIEVLDEHINAELRGLRIMCFDNGMMSSFIGYEKRINEFKNIYAEKPVFNVYFDKFETWVYPRVSFSSSTINVNDAEISLKGQTDSLQSVMQEMLLLDAKNDILGYTISNIEMNNGNVTFNLNLKVNPELFKHQNEQQ